MLNFLKYIKYNNFIIKNKCKKTPYNYSGKICIRHIKKNFPKNIRIYNNTTLITELPGFVIKKIKDMFNFKEYALIYYLNGFITYILNIAKLPVNFLVFNSLKYNNKVNLASSYPLKKYPSGCLVSNIEFKPFQGAKLCTSNGLFAKIIKHTTLNYTILQLAKKKKINKKFKYKYLYIHSNCFANFGIINSRNKIKILNKAGDSINIKKRKPRVRGVAMNPIDHPHGGGEGKTSGGRPSSTPWGIYCKGYKTLNKKIRKQKERKLRKYFIN